MSRFDFISDEKLRTSLDADYQELQNCMSVKAWKATHVIAGSIIEAILIDHLIVIGYNKINPLQMTLDQAIRACFFQTFDLVDEQVRAKLLNKFACIVKEESQYFLTTYEDAFFKAEHLKHLVSESDKNIVKKHLFSRLRSEMEISILELFEGMADHITKEDYRELLDP